VPPGPVVVEPPDPVVGVPPGPVVVEPPDPVVVEPPGTGVVVESQHMLLVGLVVIVAEVTLSPCIL
jgi:hypothetical protein